MKPSLTLYGSETPIKTVTLANSGDPDEIILSGSTLLSQK